jgi:hypothetical protein
LAGRAVSAIGCGRAAWIALSIAAHSWILIDGDLREIIDLKRRGGVLLKT